MSERTVAVAGASGFVGRSIVRELLGRGWRVQGLTRDRGRAAKVLPRDPGLKLVQGDSTDADALKGLTGGAWACINAIGILREAHGGGGGGGGQTFKKVHVDTTRALLEACRASGARRFVQVSALGVSDDGRTGYQTSKWEAEMLVRRSGLDWTIFRPSMIHGAESEFIRMAKGWVTGSKQPWLFLPYFTRGVKSGDDVPLAAVVRESARVAPVAVEDVAIAIAESLERPNAIGEIYNLTGPDVMTWPELLRALRDNIPGANPALQPLGIPAEAAAVQARAARVFGLGGLLPFDEGMARMGAADSVAGLDKAREQVGFSPRPFLRALKAYAPRIA